MTDVVCSEHDARAPVRHQDRVEVGLRAAICGEERRRTADVLRIELADAQLQRHERLRDSGERAAHGDPLGALERMGRYLRLRYGYGRRGRVCVDAVDVASSAEPPEQRRRALQRCVEVGDGFAHLLLRGGIARDGLQVRRDLLERVRRLSNVLRGRDDVGAETRIGRESLDGRHRPVQLDRRIFDLLEHAVEHGCVERRGRVQRCRHRRDVLCRTRQRGVQNAGHLARVGERCLQGCEHARLALLELRENDVEATDLTLPLLQQILNRCNVVALRLIRDRRDARPKRGIRKWSAARRNDDEA